MPKTDMLLEVGTQLGDYRILSRIGKGAYGIVFEAEHGITRRIDAVKLMLDAGTSCADEEQRFLREIQAQASLQHPNIATVYGAFRTPWGLALAMELVRGRSLRSILQEGQLAPARAAEYILPVLAGLSCAERLGVVHRDIKPDNILVTPEGTVKLTDFGLAQVADAIRITTSGENLGTPCYMSPEQVTGERPADARSDIYSTGVVLYEAVTGRPPFLGSNGFAVMIAHQNTVPASPVSLEPAIGPRLNQVILKALEKDPDQRFQSAAEFSAALEQAMAEPAVPLPGRVGPFRGRGRIVAGAAALTLAICAFGAWAGHEAASSPAPHPPQAIPQRIPPPAAAVVPDLPPAPLPAPAPDIGSAVNQAVHRRSRRASPVRRTAELSSTSPAKGGSHPPIDSAASPAPWPVLPPEIHLTAPPPAPLNLPTAVLEPPSPEDATQPVLPKHRNFLRRALGRVFGHRPENAGPQPGTSAIRPEPR